MADKRKMKTKTRVKKSQLTIDIVQELGGTKVCVKNNINAIIVEKKVKHFSMK